MATKKKNAKKVEELENAAMNEDQQAPAEAPAGAPAEAPAKPQEKALTVDEEIAKLKRELAKAKGEKKKATGEKPEKMEPPAEPTSVAISSSITLNEETGFVEVTTVIGHIVYKSYPKDDKKGIARTVVFINDLQKHEYNNIGIANVVAAEIANLPDPSEHEAITYHALKSRKEAIKEIADELMTAAVTIRAERRAQAEELRVKIKNEKIAKKEEHIAALEARLKELESLKA